MEAAQQAGAAGSSWEPDYEGIFSDIILRLEKYIMNAFLIEDTDIDISFDGEYKYLNRIYGDSWVWVLRLNLHPAIEL